VAFGIFGSRAMSVLSRSRGSAGTQTNRSARVRGESPRPLDPPGLTARFLQESRQAGSRSVQCRRATRASPDCWRDLRSRSAYVVREGSSGRPLSVPPESAEAHATTGGNPVARRPGDHERRPRLWTSQTGWRDLVSRRRSQVCAHAETDWSTASCTMGRRFHRAGLKGAGVSTTPRLRKHRRERESQLAGSTD
jgi:hypothetical protein